MEKHKRNSASGITLIALVITIIIMFILAGVSINAMIGDNGIITTAQRATYLNSIAALEEFLQMEHTMYALEDNGENTPVEVLRRNKPEYFFQTTEGYVLDSSKHTLYLINKSGLPSEIQKSMIGGNATKMKDYYIQKDVYGVTSDLKVFYCSNGVRTILGVTEEDLDTDNALDIKYDTDTYIAKFINGEDSDGKANKPLSSQDLKKIVELTIDDVNELALLECFKDLRNLERVYFQNIDITTLQGIGGATNLKYVRFLNCKVDNYADLSRNINLSELYLVRPRGGNQDVLNLCSKTVGIGNANLTNLTCLGVTGSTWYIANDKLVSYGIVGDDNGGTNKFGVTNIDAFDQLTTDTKNAVKKVYLQNLSLTSLQGLKNFNNVTLIRAEYNNLLSLSGINNMENLQYLFASSQGTNFGMNDGITKNESVDALGRIIRMF